MQENIRTIRELMQENICTIRELIAQLNRELDAKLAHIQTLLASRPPQDLPNRTERPN